MPALFPIDTAALEVAAEWWCDVQENESNSDEENFDQIYTARNPTQEIVSQVEVSIRSCVH